MAQTYSVLGQSNPSATTLTALYTVPASTEAVVSSVWAANRSATASDVRIAVAPAGASDSNEHYIVYDFELPGNESLALVTGITLEATDVIRVYTANATVSFNAFGSELK